MRTLTVLHRREGLTAIDEEMLSILTCPRCGAEVSLNRPGDGLVCATCKLVYEIRNDIPIMLVEASRPMDEPGPGHPLTK